VVYKGTLNTTPVAIKKFKETSSGSESDSDAEFIKELLVLMDVRHTHLTQLIGAILPEDGKGGRAIVSEFLEGGDVDHLLHSNKDVPISSYNLVKIARDAARGIAYLHTQGIVHKDLKPANLLLDGPVDQYSRFRCKVADFGCTKMKGQYIDKIKNAHARDMMARVTSGVRASRGSSSVGFEASVHKMNAKLGSISTMNPMVGGRRKAQETQAEGGGTALYLPPEVQLDGKNGK
jgi:serine/threonine protein kinase